MRQTQFVAGQSFITFGAKRKHGIFFLDLDSKDFDVYETKDGIHLIAHARHKFYYHGRRIRVSPKWNLEGKAVNLAPRLLYCHCPNHRHVDKRKECKLVTYVTRSK